MGHFRDLDDIQRLSERVGIRIDVFKATLQDRRTYFGEARQVVQSLCAGPLLVFLDPDTGIAPTNSDFRHYMKEDIRMVFDPMKTGDVLVCYQHARRNSDWRNDVRKDFSSTLGIETTEVEVFDSELASDVALFSVKRK